MLNVSKRYFISAHIIHYSNHISEKYLKYGDNMRNLFPGHFKESDKDIKEAWRKSLFVFDTNILLNFYRYSDTTRNEFFRILKNIKDRAWLPHRAAEEYLNNRLTVIGNQEVAYDEAKSLIDKLENKLENSRQHPFISDNTMKIVKGVFKELCQELDDNKSFHTERIKNDDIKNSIVDIFDNRVGLPYDKETLENLIIEGEERYAQKIPPGFKDESKSSSNDSLSERCRKYGDFIIWNQIIDKAIETNKDIILVTDDKKEDWWKSFKGETIGPRPELVKEFKDKTAQSFYMYQAEWFLKLSRDNLGEHVKESIFEEIREVRRLNKLENKKIEENEKLNKIYLIEEIENLRNKMNHCKQEMDALIGKRDMLETERKNIKKFNRNRNFRDDGDSIDYNKLSEDYHKISNDCEEVSDRLDIYRKRYHKLRIRLHEIEKIEP